MLSSCPGTCALCNKAPPCMCSHAATFVEQMGLGNPVTREQASMSCEECPGVTMRVSLFEVPADEAALEARPALNASSASYCTASKVWWAGLCAPGARVLLRHRAA